MPFALRRHGVAALRYVSEDGDPWLEQGTKHSLEPVY
jgi:hypothetical protein